MEVLRLFCSAGRCLCALLPRGIRLCLLHHPGKSGEFPGAWEDSHGLLIQWGNYVGTHVKCSDYVGMF